ncbi:MAG: asparagine synthase (glutamine-hydrolyzing) [bacterium]
MCGIVGIYDFRGEPIPQGLLKRMTDVIAHRGPDDEGQHCDGPLGLGHRRLSIIDLSPAGRQPMSSESGDVLVVYNGEIYNFQEIRSELKDRGHTFHSQTDTEVIIHGYEEWGVDCLHHFNGMFAFVVWDAREKRLFLARDRYGIKPLYYFYGGGLFLFASEIKSILQHPEISVQICYPALSEYFTFQNIFSDLTLFDGIRLLPAGSYMTVDTRSTTPVRQVSYWDFDFSSDGFGLSERECAEELSRRFDRAVSRQLIADVPVGSYLSGGMDSGSITALAARHIPRIHTFTGGFDLSSASGLELAFDEREASECMANLFKTEHYEIVMHAGDMEHVLPDLIWNLEDLRVGQCYPNYYVARLASKFVKVVLSGTGGDELFAGYPWRYYRGMKATNADSYYDGYYDYWQRLIPDTDRSMFFNSDTFSHIRHHEPRETFRNVFRQRDIPLNDLPSMVNASLYFEIKTFLHGLFLVEDKLSMAHSLETRVPFMDNDLVDFALRIPPSYKLRNLAETPIVDEDELGKKMKYEAQPNRDGKVILREAMKPLIPTEIINRAKQGFSAPDASWFRGESIDYVNKFLRDPKAEIYHFLDLSYVSRVLDEHTGGSHNRRLLIWSLLCFEWWCKRFL